MSQSSFDLQTSNANYMNKQFLSIILVLVLFFCSKDVFSLSQPTDHFRSDGSGDWNDKANWKSSPDSIIWEDATLVPSIQSRSVVVNSSTLKINGVVEIQQLTVTTSGSLKIESGSLTINNSNSGISDLRVYGTLWNQRQIILNCSGEIMEGGIYRHSYLKAGNIIPNLTWNDGSTIMICDLTNPFTIQNFNQPFYNVYFFQTENTENIILNLPDGFTTRGDLHFFNQKGPYFYLTNSVNLTNFYVSGNLIIENVKLSYNYNTNKPSNIFIGKDIIFGSNAYLIGSAGFTNAIFDDSSVIHNIAKFSTYIKNTTLIIDSSVKLNIPNTASLAYNNTIHVYGHLSVGELIETSPDNLIVYPGGTLNTPKACAAKIIKEVANADWTSELDGMQILSSPVSDQSLATGGFISNPLTDYDFFSWDEPGFTWLNQKVPDNKITAFVPGCGYFAGYNQGGEKTFSGNVNISSITFSNLSVTGASTVAGFHLLGNPYPCIIDWSNDGWNRLNISSAAYLWDEPASNYLPVINYYNNLIPSCTGFFVQAIDPINALTIPISAKMSGLKASELVESQLLVIKVQSQSNETFDKTIILLDSQSNNLFDENDGRKMKGSNLAPQVYTLNSSLDNLMVNALPDQGFQNVIPLILEKGQDAEYQFFVEKNNLNTDVYLEDSEKGSYTPLLEGATLNVTCPTKSKQFNIHLSPVSIPESSYVNHVKVYYANNQIFVRNLPSIEKWDFALSNLSGSLVKKDHLYNSSIVSISIPSSISPGVYIATFKSKECFFSKKVIIL